jgi:hypothetical protein
MYVPGVGAFNRLVRSEGGAIEHHCWPGVGDLPNQKFRMSIVAPSPAGEGLKFGIDWYINSIWLIRVKPYHYTVYSSTTSN